MHLQAAPRGRLKRVRPVSLHPWPSDLEPPLVSLTDKPMRLLVHERGYRRLLLCPHVFNSSFDASPRLVIELDLYILPT